MKRSLLVTMVVVLAAVPMAIPTPAFAAPGSLDTTFGNSGTVTTDFGSGGGTGYGVAIQSDGKIVVAGVSYAGFGGRFALARYNTDGTLDTTFSGDGKARTSFGPRTTATAYAVAIQADGKIVAAGDETGSGRSGNRFALARYNTDGTLDSTFGGDGKVSTNFNNAFDGAFAVAIQADGRILAAGAAGGSSLAPKTFALARYRPNGRLDTTFSGDGKVRTDFVPGFDSANAVAIQADGKIVAAGEGGRSYPRFELARYGPNGSLDTTFSGDGKVRTNFTDEDDDGVTESGDEAFAMAIQADGKIVAAGHHDYLSALARYNTDGSLDTTFDGNGKIITLGGPLAYAVAIQADGKIVAAGYGSQAFVLARHNTEGSLDPTFGDDLDQDGIPDGWVSTDFTTDGDDGAYAVTIQADGKIVAAGYAGLTGEGGGSFAVARYLAA